MKFTGKKVIPPRLPTRRFRPIRRLSGFFPLVTCSFTLSLIFFSLIQFSEAAQIKIAWDPNTEEDLAGYRVYYGPASRTYGQPITIGMETTYTITDLTPGQRYYIAVTAFDTANNESDYSNEVNGIAPDTLLGKWDVDISGGDRGAAVLWFEEHTKVLGGYGISAQLQLFGMEGSYSLDSDGSIDGTCAFYGFQKGDTFSEGNPFTGKIRSKSSRIKIGISIAANKPLSMSMKGEQAVEDAVMPEDWTVRISGVAKGKLETLTIEPYQVDGLAYPHLFRMIGIGTIEGNGPIEINGAFFLTGRDKAFGIWELTGLKSDHGAFGGRLDPVSGRFKFRMKGEQGSRYTFVGQVRTE